ncbi:BOS complex subunit ncln [Halyomorpha halys]|uniref:BOS complex subunit ncln n=1 Tax=Halyomorpha halys TaxID=286706 RepID=UPI0006D4C925|nr:nicalin-1-like [Halyomorpha halys]XP_014288799.1 nicalin-1 [Halyomorpha halys]
MIFVSDEFCELFKGSFPFYILCLLPIILLLSPGSLVNASHEFNVYRMHQYDLHGLSRGCRTANLNLEARSLTSWSTQRHCVVARLEHLASHSLHNIKENSGGLLLVLPQNIDSLTSEMREILTELEMQLLDDETMVPIYFIKWSPELEDILIDIENNKLANDKGIPAWEAILQSFSANGYQIVINAGKPAVRNDANIVSIQGKLSGYGIEDKLPTIAIVAHIDSFGVAPELSFGADSNGSGIVMMLELIRIFSHLYSNSRAHAPVNILFFLSGGGKFNYQGSKKWLEDHLDTLEGSLLQEAIYVLCLDTVSSNKGLFLHVSKPPKEGSSLAKFFQGISVTSEIPVEIVHKKINLADEMLAWEHERFSIRRLPAATISAIKSHKNPVRGTVFDTYDRIDVSSLTRNIEIVASSLARQIYNISGSSHFSVHMGTEEEMVKTWLEFLASHSRSSSLLFEKNNPLIKSLQDVFNRYLEDVKLSAQTSDKRDPEFMFYDTTSAVVNIYNVKPAIFDLFLTVIISLYLFLVFGVIKKMYAVYIILTPSSPLKKVKS